MKSLNSSGRKQVKSGKMDRILFGDNQFFAVNHLSDEKSRAQSIQFRKNEAIIKVLDTTIELGIKTFMCTTHDRIAGICDHKG